jgi:protein-S-isoprenylcysteine O-methyltransferase Ste14
MNGGEVKVVVFIAVSVLLLYVSRKSLRVVGSHGFYRIFAWEAILAIIILNSHTWFKNPFSVLQIFSWLFLLVSLALLVPGAYRLMASGKPTTERKDDTLFPFEKTTVLVTDGVYRYIRHPLYGSLLCLAWGAFLKEVTVSSVVLIGVATVCLVATAMADEIECVRYFGRPYEEYMRRTKMFVPFLF